eukprot:4112734-Pyramimonas_sp.AAC.1
MPSSARSTSGSSSRREKQYHQCGALPVDPDIEQSRARRCTPRLQWKCRNARGGRACERPHEA